MKEKLKQAGFKSQTELGNSLIQKNGKPIDKNTISRMMHREDVFLCKILDVVKENIALKNLLKGYIHHDS